MRLPEPKLAKLKFPTLVALAAALLAQSPAWAAFSNVSFGIGLPVPQGDAYQTLSRKLSYNLEAWYDEDGTGEKLKLHGQLFDQMYSLRNVDNTSLTITGALVGVVIEGGKSLFGLTPFVNADVGFVYDSLSFSNAASVTSNTGTAIALQLEPGVDLKLWGDFGVMYEMPIMDALYKNNLAIWSSIFAVRWKL